MTHEALPPLIAALSGVSSPLSPEPYPIAIISTHISWVLLTREHAYKIKKPVNLGFVDFTSLERRRFFCHEELRLNRRFAPDLYLDVIPIYGSPECPILEPIPANRHTGMDCRYPVDRDVTPMPSMESGFRHSLPERRTKHPTSTEPARQESADLPIEYAVKLCRFEQSETGPQLARHELLTQPLMEDLAETLARFHNEAQRASSNSPYGKPDRIQADSADNFALLALLGNPDIDTPSACAQRYAEQEFLRIAPILKARKNTGFIRECHGDLHLGNLVRFDGRLIPFDCIEFNASLRWIDVINDLAFLYMDLEAHEHRAAAFQMLNRYLELSGDYAGMAVFRYYSVYRAMVRAKIAHLNNPGALSSGPGNAELKRYLACAARLSSPDKPTLYITHGFSGSGKSWLARQLAPQLAAIRISSDVERKRLHGFAALDNTKSSPGESIYSHAATRATYAHLRNTAKMLLRTGYNTLVDATFLLQKHRQTFAKLARTLDADFRILDMSSAPRGQLEARIQARMASKNDPSEADIDILALQLQYAEPLNETEKSQLYFCNHTVHPDMP